MDGKGKKGGEREKEEGGDERIRCKNGSSKRGERKRESRRIARGPPAASEPEKSLGASSCGRGAGKGRKFALWLPFGGKIWGRTHSRRLVGLAAPPVAAALLVRFRGADGGGTASLPRRMASLPAARREEMERRGERGRKRGSVRSRWPQYYSRMDADAAVQILISKSFQSSS